MRTTLMPALVNNFLYNLSHGIRDVKIFEVARVFIDWGRPLPSEGLRLAGLFFEDRAPSLWKDNVPAFYAVKGVLEALFGELRLKEYSFTPSDEQFLHGGKSCDIQAGGRKLGYLGELGPQVIEALALKIQKPQVIVFEIDLDQLMPLLEETIVFRSIPRYPAIERDVALVIDDRMAASDLLALFRSGRSELVEQVELFDHYKGKNLPPDSKSLGIRIVYRSKDHTLTEAEVEPLHLSLLQQVIEKTGAKIRGAD